jgi:hypothetical protein
MQTSLKELKLDRMARRMFKENQEMLEILQTRGIYELLQ